MNFKYFFVVLKKNLNSFKSLLPIFLSIIFLISLVDVLFGVDFYKSVLVFENDFLNSFVLNFFGSVFAGNAIISYMIGESMVNSGVGLYLVLVFILAWVNVGVIQLPAEMFFLGKKFAIVRNLVVFFTNFLVAYLIIYFVGLF
jgi:hypothetical protein